MSDAPLQVGHPDHRSQNSDLCGCCNGTTLSTLQQVSNRPNLTSISYRTGDHGRFKASMLTSLSSPAFPALIHLGTREDDDFTIALIDAWASACDVLTFYQERHANEAYIQTATERLSITEIARLTGYRLHPGSAAETEIVLLMEDPPGAKPDVAELEVPSGTQIQSQPGPDEEPQVFETLDGLAARVAWNSLRPRLNRHIVPDTGARQAWLKGAPALQVGDALLFVGPDRWDEGAPGFDKDSSQWGFRRVTGLSADAAGDRTLIRWDDPLDSVDAKGLRLYALRERASLFGHNAPSPKVLSGAQLTNYIGTYDTISIFGTAIPTEWRFSFVSGNRVPLDAIYKGFVPGGWAVMTRSLGFKSAYRINDAQDDGLTKYAISGRSTQLTFDTQFGFNTHLALYRSVSVYGASEELSFADTPLHDVVAGKSIELNGLAQGLPEGRKLIFAGRRAQLEVKSRILKIKSKNGDMRAVTRGTVLTLMSAPNPIPGQPKLAWVVRTDDGFVGISKVEPKDLRPVPAGDDAEAVTETATLDTVLAADARHATLVLATALKSAFDRGSLTIHANVARASHGQSVSDILGAGAPARPFQSFSLKQNPVTHLVASTENGVQSTLSIRIDGIAWTEVRDLYERGPAARVFATSLNDDGETMVHFGDGASGARPPAGRDNIQAEHRQGLGRAGNVRIGQLSLPLNPPLGLKEVTNPFAASGGAEAQTTNSARYLAPIHTLTLGRLVSITDYRDFALGYPGIAKADARWVWQGESRRIVVTVAGDDGATIATGDPVYTALLDAYREYGDPLVAFEVISYQPAHFRIGLKVAIDEAFQQQSVLADVEATLRAAFAFDAREFAQPVALSDIAAVAHRAGGVVAVDIDALYRLTPPQASAKPHRLLAAKPGRREIDGALLPAEILTLAPGPFHALEVMA